jgi:hypothetical protein
MRKGDKSLKIYRGCKISKTIKTLMTLFKIEKKIQDTEPQEIEQNQAIKMKLLKGIKTIFMPA